MIDRQIILALKDAKIVVERVIAFKQGTNVLHGDTFLSFTLDELNIILRAIDGPTVNESDVRYVPRNGEEVQVLSGNY